MKLYYFPISTYSQKALIGLYEKGVDFERELVRVLDPDMRTLYEEIYPIGKIPLLMADDDHMIPEASIIIEYLDQNFDTGTQLLPAEPVASRKVRFMDRMNDLYLNDATVNLLFQGMKPESEQNTELMEKSRKHLTCSFEYINDTLSDKTWLFGDQFTLADCAAIPPLFYAQKVFPFNDYPQIQRYFDQAQQRPSYQKVLEEALPVLEQMNM